MRIKGVGEEYSDLLEEAGVDSVKELRNRVPANLHQKLLETNKVKKLVRRVPSFKEVRRWVQEAKVIPPVVTH
jgi:glycine cleavage system pyridoxal-binding protein P